MQIAPAVLGVVFVAFCIWLAIRIINRREHWAIGAGILISTYAGIFGILAVVAGPWLPSPFPNNPDGTSCSRSLSLFGGHRDGLTFPAMT